MASPLIETSHGWFRNWFRKVWKVRGGGLYALGLAFVGFTSYLKKPIENWMFDGEPAESEEPETSK